MTLMSRWGQRRGLIVDYRPIQGLLLDILTKIHPQTIGYGIFRTEQRQVCRVPHGRPRQEPP